MAGFYGNSSKSTSSGGFYGGGGKSSSSKKKEKGGRVAKQGELNTAVGKAEQLGVGEQAKQIATKVAVNPILKALELADLPRAAVVSAAGELGDAIGMGEAGDKASLDDFLEQVKRHQGVGEYVQAANGGKGTGNKWLDRGLGLVGDVALDPLSYLTFGASAVGKPTAKLGAQEAARLLAAKGLLKEGDDVLRMGTKVIGKEAAEKAGIELGASIGVGKAKVAIPHTDGITRAIGKVTGPAKGAIADSKPARGLAKLFNAVPVPENVATGEQGRIKKLLFEDAYRQARGLAQGSRQQGAAELNAIAARFKDVDGKNLLDELEGAATGDPRAVEAAAEMRAWFDTMAARMEEATGRKIGRREDYAPWMLTAAVKEKMGTGVGRAGTKAGMERRRTLADEGAEWLGHELTGNAAQRRAQIEQIAKDTFGDDYEQVFIDNPWELANRYLNGVERYVTNHGTVAKLVDSPLAVTPRTVEVARKGYEAERRRLATAVDYFTSVVRKEEGARVKATEKAGVLRDVGDARMATAEDMRTLGLEYRRRANRQGWEALTDEQRIAELAKDPVVVSGIEFRPVPAEEFAEAITVARAVEKRGRSVGETVYQYPTDEYRGMATFLSPDGKTGYAVKPDGDLVSVFNVGERGAGEAAVAGGIRAGASKLDAFDEDGFLPQKYGKFGFEETGRDAWDPQYAPEGWKGGTPDVAYMERTGDPTILRREPVVDSGPVDAARAALDAVPETLVGRAPSVERAMQRDFDELVAQARKRGRVTQEAKDAFREQVELRWREKPAKLAERIELLKAQRAEALDSTVTKVSPEARELASRRKALGDRIKTTKSPKMRERLENELDEVMDRLEALEGTTGRVGTPEHVVAKLDQQIAQAEKELADLAPRGQARPNPARAQAEKVVADLKADLDHTMAHAEEVRRANDEALRQVERDVAEAIGRRRQKLEEVTEWRRRASSLFEARDAEVARGREAYAAVAELEAVAADHAARAAEAGRKAMGLEEALRKLKPTEMHTQFGEMYERGLKEFAGGRWAEPWVAEAATQLAEFNARGGTGAFLKTFDWIQSRWKAYALLSPGFHIRNFMGGVFNNSLAGVDVGSYRTFLRAHAAYRKGGLEAITDVAHREAYSEMLKRGVLGEANVRDISDVAGAATGGGVLGQSLRSVDPTSLDNAALRVNRKGAEHVESTLRGPLFMDRMLKGQTADEAWDAVAKYHFDYGDLSAFERDVLKRVVPFYTWTRKNFPLQIESMLQQPGKYTRFLHAKRNIEMGTEEEEVTPKYFGSLMAIRTDLKTPQGDRVYYTPDLPFRDLAEQFSLGTLVGQVSPIIRTPWESATKTKTYEEFVPMSDRLEPAPTAPGWKQILPVLEKLGGKAGLPKVEKADDGTYLMEEAQVHKINELIPLLARMRRLAPSEKKYQDRQITTALSFLTGQGLVTNTKDAQAGELARRVGEVQDLIKREKSKQAP